MQTKITVLIIVAAITAAYILGTSAAALDSAADMQCGTQIVTPGASPFEVREKCGEPTRIEPGPGIGREQWIYNFGPTEFVYYLTFVNGELERIEVGGYGD